MSTIDWKKKNKKYICYQKTSILKRHITIAIGAKYNAKIAHIEKLTHNNRCSMAKCIDTFDFWVVFFYVFGFIPKSQLVSPPADYIFSFIPFTISYYIRVYVVFSFNRSHVVNFVCSTLIVIHFVSVFLFNLITNDKYNNNKKKKQNEPK